MIKIIEKGLAENPSMMCKSCYQATDVALDAIRMCRNSEFKDPILHVENNPTRMCGNSECGGHYMSLNGGTLNALRMCRNSEFKDPVYMHELCAKAS